MEFNFTAAMRPLSKAVALFSILLVSAIAAKAQNITVNVDVIQVDHNYNCGNDGGSANPEPRWRVRAGWNGGNFAGYQCGSNCCGSTIDGGTRACGIWDLADFDLINITNQNATTLNVDIHTWEDDDCGSGCNPDDDCWTNDDDVIDGPNRRLDYTIRNSTPCTYNQVWTNYNSGNYRVQVDVYWYYVSGFSAGSINGAQTICSGGNPSLLTSASNGTTGNYIGYQWQYLNGGTWTDISGATSSTYDPPSGLTATRSYRRLVKADQSCNPYSVASNTIVVTVVQPGSGGTVSPSSQTICASEGNAATLPTLSGSNGTIARWEYQTPGSSTWTTWAGTSTTAPSGNIFTSLGTYQVRAVIQNSPCAIVYSSTADVVVVADPSVSIALTGGAATHCGTGTATLTASGTGGTGTGTYQWQYYNGSTWVNIGGNSATLATGTLTATRQYRCLYNTSGTNCTQATSNTITITINPLPNAAISVSENSGTTANDGTICIGASLSLTGSGGTSYTWSNSLGTNATITITPENSDIIFLTVSNGDCETTIWQNVIVNSLPTPTAQASTPVCEGTTISLTADGGSSYAWSGPAAYNGSGATPNRANATTAMAGVYTVTVTDGNGCTASTVTNAVSINPMPIPSISYISCPGVDGNTSILVTAIGASAPYQYRIAPAAFATANTFSVPNGSAGNNIEVSDAIGCISVLSFSNPMLTPTTIAASDMAASPCGSNAENRPVYIANGTNLIAIVNDQGQDLGEVSGAIWFHAAPTVYNGDAFAKTSWTMHASNQPSGDVELNLPYTVATYNELVATADATSNLSDDISSMDDIGATRYWGANEDNVYNSTEGNVMYLRQDHNGTILNGHYVAVYTPGFSEYWLHGSQDLTALPVTLKTLTAEAIDNKHIQVKWTTALEIDNAGFALERSQDGINFTAIEWIKGNGNSTIEHNYSYDDMNVMPGTYYYRLKQVDNDGSSEYSAGMVSATITPNGIIAITPNPTTGYVTLNFPGTKSATVSIRSATGALVKEDIVAPFGHLDLSAYADGVYFITINGEIGRHTMRVVKAGK